MYNTKASFAQISQQPNNIHQIIISLHFFLYVVDLKSYHIIDKDAQHMSALHKNIFSAIHVQNRYKEYSFTPLAQSQFLPLQQEHGQLYGHSERNYIHMQIIIYIFFLVQRSICIQTILFFSIFAGSTAVICRHTRHSGSTHSCMVFQTKDFTLSFPNFIFHGKHTYAHSTLFSQVWLC